MNKLEKLLRSQPKWVPAGHGEVKILCPWHDDKEPSLAVNVFKAVFFCYGCGRGKGEHISTLIKRLTEWSTLRIWDVLSDSMQNLSPQEREIKAIKLPRDYAPLWDPDERRSVYGAQAWYYIQSRKITQEQVRKYKIGFCARGDYSQRIIIPITTEGQTLSFVARDFSGRALVKVKYPPGSLHSHSLFGYDFSKGKKGLVIVEGWADALAVERALKNFSVPESFWGVVAIGSTDVSHKKMLLLTKFSRFLVFGDSDKPGRKAAAKLALGLSIFSKQVVAVFLDNYKDPAEASEKDAEQVVCSTLVGGWDRIGEIHDNLEAPRRSANIQPLASTNVF